MPDPTRYLMSFRPIISLPERERAHVILTSIQDREAREEPLEYLDSDECDHELLECHLSQPDAEYVRQYIEGIEVAGFTLGVEDGMVDFSFSILLRQSGPESFVYGCRDDSEPSFERVATLKSVASFEEMLEVVRSAFDRIFPDAPWPQPIFSGDLSVQFDPGHYCLVRSAFYPELSIWFEDFVEEYSAEFRSRFKGLTGP